MDMHPLHFGEELLGEVHRQETPPVKHFCREVHLNPASLKAGDLFPCHPRLLLPILQPCGGWKPS